MRKWAFKEIEEVRQKSDTILGRGSFSVVYAGVSSTGRQVAIKTIDKAVYRAAAPGDQATWTSTFNNEIQLLRRLKHPNLVQLLGWGLEGGGGRLAVVLERMEETLSTRLSKTAGKARPSPMDRYALVSTLFVSIIRLTQYPIVNPHTQKGCGSRWAWRAGSHTCTGRRRRC